MKNNKFFLTILSFSLVFVFSVFFNNVEAQDVIPPEEVDPEIVVEEPVLTANFIIRVNDQIIWQGDTPLGSAGSIEVLDSASNVHQINAHSVLAVLKKLDDSSESFAISNLQYYDSFGSFYLKCLTSSAGESCDNWQYALGEVTPWQSIEQTILTGGETVGIYFGTPHRLTLSKDQVLVGENFVATTQKYNYVDNSWNPFLGVSVGVTLPNPADQWNPTVLATYPVDASGNTNISIDAPETYTLGIVEDYYFPAYQVTVSPLPVVTSSGGGSGGVSPVEIKNEAVTPVTEKIFDLPSALDFLKNKQDIEGSFGLQSLYTDWVAIAYGATDTKNEKLLDYLKSNNKISNFLTDNERRAMALMALNQNPYSFEGINYIEAIVKSFDGVQFGDPNLMNDDVFAIIPLTNAGFIIEDEMIHKTISFIITKQKENGSWEESVDMTVATIQALKPFEGALGVTEALVKANKYIKNNQKSDGGFGSVSSTSWVMQASNILDSNVITKNTKFINYLGAQQQTDGGLLPETELLANRIWATSYAIPGFLGKTWNEILYKFPKEIIKEKEEVVVKEIEKQNEKQVISKLKTIKKIAKNNTKVISNSNTEDSIGDRVEDKKILEKVEYKGLSANVLDSEIDMNKKGFAFGYKLLLEFIKFSIFKL